MALILPLVLVMTLATFEGAWYLVCEHRVIKGVRDAARYAARLPRDQFTCPGGAFTGSTATVQNLARTGKLTGGNAQVPGWVNGDVTVSVICATLTAGSAGIYNSTGGNAPRVTVRTQFNYPSMMGTLGFSQTTVQIGAAAQSPVIGL